VQLIFFLQGASRKLIVGWVVGNPIGFIDVFGDNGLSENQPKKPFDVLIFGLKVIFDSRIIEHPADHVYINYYSMSLI